MSSSVDNETLGNSCASTANAGLRVFDSRAELAQALAKDIADKLKHAIEKRGQALIAFSGGSTPAQMLANLAEFQLDWSKVHITLVDERCVDMQSNRSNARLLFDNLIDRLGIKPRFYPLFETGETIDDIRQRLTSLSMPFDVVHLGMGGDAHTASFFPDTDNIDNMLDMEAEERLMTTRSEASQEQRITWSLVGLMQSRYIVVQLCGEEKQRVLDNILEALSTARDSSGIAADTRRQLPLIAVLEQTQLYCENRIPATIYSTYE